MSNIKVRFENSGIEMRKVVEYQEKVEEIDKEIRKNSSKPEEFLGWLNLPTNYDKEEFERIKKAAEAIRNNSKVFICIGIGGSYLGARAVIEAIKNGFYNPNSDEPQILYAGNNLSSTYIAEMIEAIGDKDISINVISKSGTTTEPAIAFRIFKKKDICDNRQRKRSIKTISK